MDRCFLACSLSCWSSAQSARRRSGHARGPVALATRHLKKMRRAPAGTDMAPPGGADRCGCNTIAGTPLTSARSTPVLTRACAPHQRWRTAPILISGSNRVAAVRYLRHRIHEDGQHHRVSIGVVAEDPPYHTQYPRNLIPRRRQLRTQRAPSCRRHPPATVALAPADCLDLKNSSASTARIRSSCGLRGPTTIALCQLWGPIREPPTALLSLGTAAGGPRALGCRRGPRDASTPRWSMPEISCPGFVSTRCGPLRGDGQSRIPGRRDLPSELAEQPPRKSPWLLWTG